jgi:hypothetical protein
VASLTVDDLDGLADARLLDAEALLGARRYEGARYVCGYAVELKLKARISRAHGWAMYPPVAPLAPALKTHHLEVLLLLSTMHAKILTEHSDDWSVVVAWHPEQRYEVTPLAAQDAQRMIEAARTLMAVL